MLHPVGKHWRFISPGYLQCSAANVVHLTRWCPQCSRAVVLHKRSSPSPRIPLERITVLPYSTSYSGYYLHNLLLTARSPLGLSAANPAFLHGPKHGVHCLRKPFSQAIPRDSLPPQPPTNSAPAPNFQPCPSPLLCGSCVRGGGVRALVAPCGRRLTLGTTQLVGLGCRTCPRLVVAPPCRCSHASPRGWPTKSSPKRSVRDRRMRAQRRCTLSQRQRQRGEAKAVWPEARRTRARILCRNRRPQQHLVASARVQQAWRKSTARLFGNMVTRPRSCTRACFEPWRPRINTILGHCAALLRFLAAAFLPLSAVVSWRKTRGFNASRKPCIATSRRPRLKVCANARTHRKKTP